MSGSYDSPLAESVFGKRVSIDIAGETIAASLHQPEKNAGVAPVLLLHGLGGSRHEHNGIFIRTAARMAAAGITVMRMDFRGAGESTGTTINMKPSSLVADTLAGIAFLKESCQAERVTVLGLSLGGLVASLAALESEDLDSLVLWEAPFDLIETFTRLLGPFSIEKVRARGYLQAGLLQVSHDFVEGFRRLDSRELMKAVTIPVLVVQGTDDKIVRFEDAERWRKALIGSRCEVVYVKDADHAFPAEAHAEKAIAETIAWLSTRSTPWTP
ncbi:MAG: alpha/beta fold hydrolase [Cyanobacteria bacterium HKST-UBA02]|nr:alpha/beta fold hydrolase [Cyanobacteria bacterium HKST-UBA02]